MDQKDDNGLYLTILKQVLEKTEDTHSSVKDLRKDLDLHIQKTEFELKGIRELDSQQNDILLEHHDRSTQLKRENDLREKQLRLEMAKMDLRVSTLEEPRKVITAIAQGIKWLGGIAIAIASIYGLWNLFR